MTINKINSVNLQNCYKVNSVNKVSEKKIQEKDSLQISELGKKLNNYGVDTTKIDKEKRVEELRELIKKGEYKVDTKKLAESMIDSMKGRKF